MDTNGILALAGVIGAIIIVVIQQMYPTIPKYIGWPIVGILLIVSILFISPSHISLAWEICIIAGIAISMCILSVFFWRRRMIISQPKADSIAPLIVVRSNSRREDAHAIHQRIMELTTELWETKGKLSDNSDLQKNQEIQHIMDELQVEISNLGHLINRRDYGIWSETLMKEYSRFLEFHYPVHSEWGEWGRARINTKFRSYINKIKG